jgi:alanine dehydrogenase
VLNNQALYLSRADVEAVNLPMKTIISLLEQAFREKGAGKVEMPPKPGIHTMPDTFIHAMPASNPGMHSAGIKWVGGYPENPKRGLPFITGLLASMAMDDMAVAPEVYRQAKTMGLGIWLNL